MDALELPSTENGCVFCRIAAGSEFGSILYQDSNVLAFLDYMPINPGHVLVIPRRHATNLAELDPGDGARLFQLAQRFAATIRASALPCDGINLIMNDGALAGQRVFHAHLHVIPRISGDNLKRDPAAKPSPRTELEVVAATIREQMARDAIWTSPD